MASNHYRFVTRWRVEGTCEEVYPIISHGDVVRWWPEVFLEAEVLHEGDARGIGQITRFKTRGRLPYTLRWESRHLIRRFPERLVMEAKGDFEGTGEWNFTQDGAWVNMVYEWKVVAEKPLLRYLSVVFKPIFSLNHAWAMARGLEGLKRELERCRKEGIVGTAAPPWLKISAN